MNETQNKIELGDNVIVTLPEIPWEFQASVIDIIEESGKIIVEDQDGDVFECVETNLVLDV